MSVETADAVVIGGGINGTNIAFFLAKKGLRKVILIEKTAIAAAASGKTGGLISSHFSTELKVRLGLDAMQTWKHFGEVYQTDARPYHQQGRVWLVPEVDLDSMHGIIGMQQEFGANARALSKEDFRELAPNVSVEGVAGIAYEEDGGYAEGFGATSAVAQAAVRQGAIVRVGEAVREITVAGGKVSGVRTESDEISSRLVFNAANVWAPRLLEPLGVKLPIEPARAQIGLWRRPTDFGPPTVVVADFVQANYMRDYPSDMLFVGGMDPLLEEHIPNPDDYEETATWQVIKSHRDHMWNRFPIMKRATFRGGYSGLYDMSPDLHPILDRVPGADGLFVACGFSGDGFKYGPVVGRLFAEWALDGRPSMDISALSLDRFERGKLISGTFKYQSSGWYR
jgi:sarcosine oxidase, subunit beta